MNFSKRYRVIGTSFSVLLLIIIILLASGLPFTAGLQETRTKPGSNVTTISTELSPIAEFHLKSESQPLGITMGPDGNIWFAENNSTALVKYNPTNQTFQSYTIPISTTSMIWFIITDSKGDLWFSNQLQPYLWRFSLSTHQFANFSTDNSLVRPFGLAYDNLTNQIWFTSTYTDQIGYFILHNETATMGKMINVTGTPTLRNPPLYGPTGIQIGPQGNIFVSEPFSGNIVEYNPSQQKFINVWKLPPGAQPVGISLDNQNERVWFANHASSLFGYVDLETGTSTEFATSPFEFFGDTISLPYWARVTSNGTVWFDEHGSNKIARYDPSTGILTEFAIPTNQSAPLHFVIDSRRQVIWFTEFFGSNLGEVNQNATCNCIVQLSARNLTLVSNSVSFYLKYVPPESRQLDSQSPAPLISGTFQINGYLTDNMSTSSTVVNSSFYKITLTRGPDLTPGNYSITVCPRIASSDNITSPGPVRQCATASISVEGSSTASSGTISSTNTSSSSSQRGSGPSIILVVAAIVIVIIVASTVLSIVYMRGGRSSDPRADTKES